jgi:hypothetical protein
MAGAFCRDGRPAGVTVKPTGSKDLFLYVEGGGVCFDVPNCGANGAAFHDEYIEDTHRALPTAGLFDTTNAANPIAGWNVVYVPYCTGDMHLGTNPNGHVPLVVNGNEVPGGDPTRLQFVGRINLNLILQSVVATFPDVQRILVAGASAGGVGALGSVIPIEQAFAKAGHHPQIVLIDDSGPPLAGDPKAKPPIPDANDYFPLAAQQTWRDYFGLDASILAECGADCLGPTGQPIPNFINAYARHVGRLLAAQGVKPGFVVADHDVALGTLFALAKSDVYGGLPIGYSFENALADLRTRIDAPDAAYFTTYYVNSISHMWINQSAFYSTTQKTVTGGVPLTLVDWVRGVIAGGNVPSAGPN